MLNLRRDSVLWSLKSQSVTQDSYLFPTPFELQAILRYQNEVVDFICGLDVSSAGLRDYRNAITPKSMMGFRISTQLDPIDSIITHAILYEIAGDLERPRIPRDQKIVHSFRLNPTHDGQLYDPRFSYSSFLEEARAIALTNNYSHVLLTDIADFFPSVYLHDIETALREAVRVSGRSDHVEVLINHIKAMHLSQTHKGIPVGPQFARPIAELILCALDHYLLSKGIRFLRFLDDYVFFANSHSAAYKVLASFAQKLYEVRNLKLNERKTRIVSIEEFAVTYLRDHTEVAQESVLRNFKDLLKQLGIASNPYEEIDLEDLTDGQRESLQNINLQVVLTEELAKDDPEFGLISFLLANLARVDNTSVAEILLRPENARKLMPKFRSVIIYLTRVRSFSPSHKALLGSLVLQLLNDEIIGQIDFNRAWLSHLFTLSDEWDNKDRLSQLHDKYSDDLTRREIYLALGRSHDIGFFRLNKQMNLNMDSWLRRSFLAAISCLPSEERNPWYKSRSLKQRDFLDEIVEKWALAQPF